MELGDRTSAMETVSGGDRRSEEFQNSNGRIFDTTKTKAEQLSEIGISAQRANEAEQMAKSRAVVEQYIEEAITKEIIDLAVAE